jgi:hypothetical protein
MITAADHEQSYQILVAGKADAFATDDILLYGLIARHKSQDRFRVTGDYLSVFGRAKTTIFRDIVRCSFNSGAPGVRGPMVERLQHFECSSHDEVWLCQLPRIRIRSVVRQSLPPA